MMTTELHSMMAKRNHNYKCFRSLNINIIWRFFLPFYLRSQVRFKCETKELIEIFSSIYLEKEEEEEGVIDFDQ